MTKKYVIHVLPSADADMDNLEQFIVEQCSAPLTAARQFESLYQLIRWLEQYAELPAVDVELSVKYAKIIRSVTFGKKMAILYYVERHIVYIYRILPQSMIIF